MLSIVNAKQLKPTRMPRRCERALCYSALRLNVVQVGQLNIEVNTTRSRGVQRRSVERECSVEVGSSSVGNIGGCRESDRSRCDAIDAAKVRRSGSNNANSSCERGGCSVRKRGFGASRNISNTSACGDAEKRNGLRRGGCCKVAACDGDLMCVATL